MFALHTNFWKAFTSVIIRLSHILVKLASPFYQCDHLGLEQGFRIPGNTDSWSWVILCYEELSCNAVGHLAPSLPSGTSHCFSVMTKKNVSSKVRRMTKSPLVGNQWLRGNKMTSPRYRNQWTDMVRFWPRSSSQRALDYHPEHSMQNFLKSACI